MGKDIMIDVPALCPDTVDAVVVLECEGELKAEYSSSYFVYTASG